MIVVLGPCPARIAILDIDFTHLGILLVHTSLGLGERGRGGLLGSGFGRLSLRRTVSAVQSLKSAYGQRHCCHLSGSSHRTRAATSAGGGHFGVITAACSRALRQAEAYSSGVQVMLTMVTAVGLAGEWTRSSSLAKETLQVKLAGKIGEMLEVGAKSTGVARS